MAVLDNFIYFQKSYELSNKRMTILNILYKNTTYTTAYKSVALHKLFQTN